MSYLYENNQLRKNLKYNSISSQNNLKNKNNRRESISINPDIINYIQKIQNDEDKDKSRQNLQHKNSIPSQYERLISQKIKFNVISKNQIFSEDMTFDKDKRFTAKKGLLLLLNNISKGTFCPDIEEYFKKKKEQKVEEFRNKIKDDINTFNIMDKKGKKKKAKDSSIKKLLNSMAENSGNNNEENRINYNFKKKEKNKENNREEFGIKRYENDYDEDELIELYDKKEIKDNLFHINYNKEKLYKMKLKKENMQNNQNNDN